jgi:hypothetical protein
MSAKKINTTRNYGMFVVSADNRDVDVARHKSLRASMETYGFLMSFPLSCVRNARNELVVRDGQNRLAIAEQLGLPGWWVEEEVDYDVARVASTPKAWTPKDYARKYARVGNKAYLDGLMFAEKHAIHVGTAFALLGGTTTFSNIAREFVAGAFRVKDRKWADAVADVYTQLTRLGPRMKGTRLIQACMAVCRAPGFDPKRLVAGADRRRDKLSAYATRDAYLGMLEEVYNYGRKVTVPLKHDALNAMRSRDPSVERGAA